MCLAYMLSEWFYAVTGLALHGGLCYTVIGEQQGGFLMSAHAKRYRFKVSPYLFWMTSIGWPLICANIISTVVMLYNHRATAFATGRDFWFVLALFAAFLVFFVCFYIYESRLYSGWYGITESGITLHALFRRPLSLRYDDVKYIGIGRSYGESRARRNGRFVYTPGNDFWIYLSIDPVPLAQLNDMRKFKLTHRGFRIAYSRKVYEALCECLPARLVRDLQRAETTLRAYKAQE